MVRPSEDRDRMMFVAHASLLCVVPSPSFHLVEDGFRRTFEDVQWLSNSHEVWVVYRSSAGATVETEKWWRARKKEDASPSAP